MVRRNLDLDVLRTLVMAHDLGGHGHAGERLGRTSSAVSLQLKRLSDDIGQPLFRKHGRRRVLTEAGETVLSYARRMLTLNDELLDTLQGTALDGRVRLGMAQDFAVDLLPQLLKQFAALYPRVVIEVRIEGNAALAQAVAADELDLALTVGQHSLPFAQTVGTMDLAWIMASDARFAPDAPLPLVMLGPQCAFRKLATEHLDGIDHAWRIAAVSPSLDGLWAAVRGGLGVTLRNAANLPQGLATCDRRLGLPPPGTFPVVLHSRAHDEATRRLEDLLRQALPPKNDAKNPAIARRVLKNSS